MKTRLLLLLFASGPLACLAAEPARPTGPVFSWIDPADSAVTAIRQTGERAIDRVGSMLIFEVERTLEDKSPAEAVELLHLKDLTLPKPAPGQPQVTAIKRTSLNVRNPANRPDAADQAALDNINSALRDGNDVPKLLIQRLERPDAPLEWRVYRPITTMPQCVKCHGPLESLPPGVRASLARNYPEDKAVDYATYSWRGIIRVSLAAPGPASPTKAKSP